MTTIGAMCALLAGLPGQTSAPVPWKHLETRVLTELQPADFRNGPQEGWAVLQGRTKIVAGEEGHGEVLEADGTLRLWAGDGTWQHYAVTADVKTRLARYVYVAAACEREGNKVEVGYQIGIAALKSRPFLLMTRTQDRNSPIPRPSVTSMGRRLDPVERGFWLRPDLNAWVARLRRRAPEAAERRVRGWEQELEHVPDHQNRWFRVRVEITRTQARMWLDGILMASVDRPEYCQGGISLLLLSGSQVRSVRVETIPDDADGFLPLDLSALCNGQGVGGDLGDGYAFRAEALPRPGQFAKVGGVPFLWTATPGRPNTLDVSRAAYRGETEYRMTGAEHRDPKRVMLRVPKRQYTTLALIAAANTEKEAGNVLNVRMFKQERGNVLDACFPIPRWNETGTPAHAVGLPAGEMLKDGAGSSETGRLWLVRVPLDPGAFQDFLASPDEYYLELDLTAPPRREGHPPTESRPVGVHILAATLIESPVEMMVDSDEYGQVFVEPQTPKFSMRLRNTTRTPQSGAVTVTVEDFYGTRNAHRVAFSLPPQADEICGVSAPSRVRGLHYLDAALGVTEDRVLVRRRTTFAVLPPAERLSGDASPFGMWLFAKAHYGAGVEAGCSLIGSLGARWVHGLHDIPPPYDHDIRRSYYSGMHRRGSTDEVIQKLIDEMPDIKHLSVFAENAISPDHFHLFPPELLEEPHPIPLDEEAEKAFAEYREKVISYSKAIRRHLPDKTLVFGNGYPQFISTFLSRGFPREYIDGFGLDFIGDRMNFFFYLRRVAEHYGYRDVPLHTFEGFYVGSDRGYHPARGLEEKQADIYIQGFLRGLAMGVVRFGAPCGIWDVGGWYHWTGYGNVALCHMGPELNPKPAYVAYATMTRMLDRADFQSVVPTGSTVACAVRFERPGGPVYAAWTIRGRQELTWQQSSDAESVLTDDQGNSKRLGVGDAMARFTATTSPVWLEQCGEIHSFTAGEPEHDSHPREDARRLHTFTDGEKCRFDPEPYAEIEALNDSLPVKKADFVAEIAEGKQPGTKALALRLIAEPGVSPHRFRYDVLRPDVPIEVPAGSAQVGVWVLGNGAAWIDLELEDADGKRWTTVRPPLRYDFGVQYRGPHAFEGWRYVTFPLAAPAERQQWPNHFHCEDRSREPILPAKLTGVIVQQYAEILHINRLVAPNSGIWKIGDVIAE